MRISRQEESRVLGTYVESGRWWSLNTCHTRKRPQPSSKIYDVSVGSFVNNNPQAYQLSMATVAESLRFAIAQLFAAATAATAYSSLIATQRDPRRREQTDCGSSQPFVRTLPRYTLVVNYRRSITLAPTHTLVSFVSVALVPCRASSWDKDEQFELCTEVVADAGAAVFAGDVVNRSQHHQR